MKSLWTRDLLDNPAGRFLRGIVLPFFLIGLGTKTLFTQRIIYRHFDYGGFDAACVGAGFIAIGGMGFLMCNSFMQKRMPLPLLRILYLALGLIAIAAFATALLRNL